MSTNEMISEAAIEKVYLNSGNDIGWRFLSCPKQNLDGAEIALITMNPGGRLNTPEPKFSVEVGSAYVVESWNGSKPGSGVLQKQVQELFRRLNIDPQEALSGHLVPWRSGRWKELKQIEEAILYGKSLWKEVLARARPKLVIGMGLELLDPLADLLNVGQIERIPVGWGNVRGAKASSGSSSLVVIPHLSQFKLMNKRECQDGLRALFGEHWHS